MIAFLVQVELYQSPWHWHWLMCLVKVFKRLYLLNLWIEVAHTSPDVICWSEVLCCAISAYMSDLEVKVTDLDFFLSFWLKILQAKHNSSKLCCPAIALFLCFH